MRIEKSLKKWKEESPDTFKEILLSFFSCYTADEIAQISKEIGGDLEMLGALLFQTNVEDIVEALCLVGIVDKVFEGIKEKALSNLREARKNHTEGISPQERRQREEVLDRARRSNIYELVKNQKMGTDLFSQVIGICQEKIKDFRLSLWERIEGLREVLGGDERKEGLNRISRILRMIREELYDRQV